MLQTVLEEGRAFLYEHEIYAILKSLGFNVPAAKFIRNEKEIEGIDLLAFPGEGVVCKMISPDIAHRYEIGGVRFERKDRDDIGIAFDELKELAKEKKASFEGMLVAQRVESVEKIPYQLLLSMRQDASFGPVVFMGLGGVGTEIYKRAMKEEKNLFIESPSAMDKNETLERELEETFFYPIIKGKTRISTEPIIESSLLIEAVKEIGNLGDYFSPVNAQSSVTIEELEINPLQITQDGKLYVLDGLMRISNKEFHSANPPIEKVKRLLKPKSALIIGASASKMNVGRIILRNLLKEGGIEKNHIYLLHPKASEIDGCKVVKELDEVPEEIDMLVFTIPADETAMKMLEEIVDKGIAHTITLISGGFAETEKGKSLEDRLRSAIVKARKRPDGGVAVNGPNCMGIVSRPGGYNTFFLPEYKLPMRGPFGGRCAVVSQSGAYIVTLMSNLDKIFNPRYMITYGNQIDISITDYLIALENDNKIDLFCLYLEGFKLFDGMRFLNVTRRIIESGQKIILYKAGRTEAGAKAVASHTASMSGNYEVLKKLLKQRGVIIAESLDEMEDLLRVFSLLSHVKPGGKRIGIFSNAGFECSVAADNLGVLELAHFSEQTKSKLSKLLPSGIIDIHNPVDATPQTNAPNYGKSLEAILEDDGVDCLLAANVAPTPFMENLPASPEHDEDIEHEDSYPNVTIRVFKNAKKPMVVSLNSGPMYDPAVRMMESAGVPVFRKVDRAIRALETFIERSVE